MKLKILCFGNLWAEDDGLGIHVFNALLNHPQCKNTTIIDCGIAPLSALIHLEDCDQIILVDALVDQGEVGKIHFYQQLPDFPSLKHHSSHGLGVQEFIQFTKVLSQTQKVPQISLIGAEIHPPSGFRNTLSPEIEKSKNQIVNIIIEMIA